MNTMQEKDVKLSFLNQQSVELQDGELIEGETRPRVNALYPNGIPDYDGVPLTQYESLLNTVKVYGEKEAMGFRPWINGKLADHFSFLTWNQFFTRVSNFASGLRHLGLEPGQNVGFYSKNRLEWVIACEACNSQSMPTVAIYDTFGEEATVYVINHADLQTIICSSWKDTTSKIIKSAYKTKQLKHIIQMESVSEDQVREALDHGIRLIDFETVEQMGFEYHSNSTPPSPDDVCTIMYTSGTTGVPKGVLLTHKALLSACISIASRCGGVNNTDSYLSYLPLAHIFERGSMAALIRGGGKVAFYSGDVKLLSEDLSILQPTILTGVPRVFDRMYQGVNSKLEKKNPAVKLLFKKVVAHKSKKLNNRSKLFYEREKSARLSNILLGKVKKVIGPNLRIIVSGAAPLSSQTMDFLRVCFGVPVIQGYGLTETAAGGTISDYDDPESGSVGAPIPGVQIKLIDVPDMKYFAREGKGEICIKGPNVSLGYYKEPEKTAEVFSSDGWFRTGDIGKWNSNGTLSIVDRQKNIFKLAQGEYVAAENLESIYSKSKYVEKIFIYGDSNTPSLIAVVRPDPDATTSWGSGDYESICKDPKFNEMLMSELKKIHQEAGLQGFERIEAVIVTSTEWNTENGLLTPTFKIKRPQLKEYYFNDICDAYSELGIELPDADPNRAKTQKTKGTKKSGSKKEQAQSMDKSKMETGTQQLSTVAVPA